MNASRVWLITGTSSGFGWSFAEAALKRGDKVVATARRPEVLKPLVDEFGSSVLALKLDVTDRSEVTSVVAKSVEGFGRLDVVVNNAGYGLAGGVEEVSEEEARAQMETNFFGLLWVTQAVLPQLREQRSGHILNISSIGGIAAFAGLGLYNASKWAVEALGESLAAEVEGFGIKVTNVEPSGFRTKWNNASMLNSAPMPAYDEALGGARERFGGDNPPVPEGDPDEAAKVILDLVDSEDPPLRLLLGNMAYDTAYSRATRSASGPGRRGRKPAARRMSRPRRVRLNRTPVDRVSPGHVGEVTPYRVKGLRQRVASCPPPRFHSEPVDGHGSGCDRQPLRLRHRRRNRHHPAWRTRRAADAAGGAPGPAGAPPCRPRPEAGRAALSRPACPVGRRTQRAPGSRSP